MGGQCLDPVVEPPRDVGFSFHRIDLFFIVCLSPLILRHFTMGWVYNATPEQNAMSNYPTVIAVCVALTVLMTGTVSTRLLIRTYQGRVGADDYIVLVGMVSLVDNSGSQHRR